MYRRTRENKIAEEREGFREGFKKGFVEGFAEGSEERLQQIASRFEPMTTQQRLAEVARLIEQARRNRRE